MEIDFDIENHICDNCHIEKDETYTCHNEIRYGKKCNKNICLDCCILCEKCNKIDKEKICNNCIKICNKCNKNICYNCHYKYGRCDDCWYISPLCDFCENIETDYKCDYCYKSMCNYHKKTCYNCGTKCVDCHKNYDKSNCTDCLNDLLSEDTEESDNSSENSDV